LKILQERASIHPQKPNFKSFYIENSYDTKEKLHADLKIMIKNYQTIIDALKEYPLWLEKFTNDINKQLANLNIRFDMPEIYEILDQQKLFK
jgi:hypothetical protein